MQGSASQRQYPQHYMDTAIGTYHATCKYEFSMIIPKAPNSADSNKYSFLLCISFPLACNCISCVVNFSDVRMK